MPAKHVKVLSAKQRAKPSQPAHKPKSTHVPLGQWIAEAVISGRFFYSFEYSVAHDPSPEDLFDRVQRMGHDLRPLWVDLTWGFGDIGQRTIEAARLIQKHLHLLVLMHLILTDMTVEALDAALDAARLAGVRAILAMRGFTQGNCNRWQRCDGGLDHADELVAHIKRRHGSHFSLGVVGFPETHPESREELSGATDSEALEDVNRLKAKVQASIIKHLPAARGHSSLIPATLPCT